MDSTSIIRSRRSPPPLPAVSVVLETDSVPIKHSPEPYISTPQRAIPVDRPPLPTNSPVSHLPAPSFVAAIQHTRVVCSPSLFPTDKQSPTETGRTRNHNLPVAGVMDDPCPARRLARRSRGPHPGYSSTSAQDRPYGHPDPFSRTGGLNKVESSLIAGSHPRSLPTARDFLVRSHPRIHAPRRRYPRTTLLVISDRDISIRTRRLDDRRTGRTSSYPIYVWREL
jgi:hypothetical protein